jgi:hypothetical protein
VNVLSTFLSELCALFLLIVVVWTFALLRRAVAWILGGASGEVRPKDASQQASGPQMAARRLVRDPVCGVHVAEYRAIPLREGAEIVHFCSTACRDQYIGSQNKLAANG